MSEINPEVPLAQQCPDEHAVASVQAAQAAALAVNASAPGTAPMFMLILQDNPNGEVDIAGAQRPTVFNPDSPAHLIGKWIQDNLSNIAFEVSLQKSREARLNAPASEAPPPAIVLPGSPSDKAGL